MIIEVEERFCKAAKLFSKMLNKVQLAAKRGDAVHEVEEMTWGDLIEMGRETIAAFIEEQEEELPRPEVIEHEGKQLQRLPERRVRPYVSAFGPTPFARDVYAARETQRQEVVPLDARLGMPESDTACRCERLMRRERSVATMRRQGCCLRLACRGTAAARSARAADGGSGHGRRNEASRLAGTEDRPGDRHLGHLARDRILVGTGLLFLSRWE
jgi:hypothetical protein